MVTVDVAAGLPVVPGDVDGDGWPLFLHAGSTASAMTRPTAITRVASVERSRNRRMQCGQRYHGESERRVPSVVGLARPGHASSGTGGVADGGAARCGRRA